MLGREGAGLHDLVKRTCDFLLRIPMAGSVSSLNVSVAGAVVMYEAMRQRRAGAVPARRGVQSRRGLAKVWDREFVSSPCVWRSASCMRVSSLFRSCPRRTPHRRRRRKRRAPAAQQPEPATPHGKVLYQSHGDAPSDAGAAATRSLPRLRNRLREAQRRSSPMPTARQFASHATISTSASCRQPRDSLVAHE